MRQIDFTQLRAIDLHGAGIFAVDALKEPRHGRFAGAAAADQAHHGAGGDGKTHLVQRGALAQRIGEGHILEGNLALEFRPHAVALRAGFGGVVQHPGDLADRRTHFLEILHQLGEADERRGDAAAEQHERDQPAAIDRGVVLQRQIRAHENHAT
jgi:hypothetical protein